MIRPSPKTEPPDVPRIPGYRDLQQVGSGGSGVVYRAHHEESGATVAVKVLAVELRDARARRRSSDELQRLADRSRSQPDVVAVQAFGFVDRGRPYVVTDYYEAGSLHDQLATQGALPLNDVLRIGAKVAAALGAAHLDGVVHGDVKPQNIMLSRGGEPVLADFGTGRLTAGPENAWRKDPPPPVHAAPESLRGAPASAAADIYSLGSTLYHLLAGRPPYSGHAAGGVAALLLAMLSDEEPQLARADVPPTVLGAIRRAMAAEPTDRFRDGWTFATALQQLQVQVGLPPTELPATASHPGTAAGAPEAGRGAPTPAGSEPLDAPPSPDPRPVTQRPPIVPFDDGDTIEVEARPPRSRLAAAVAIGAAILAAAAVPLLVVGSDWDRRPPAAPTKAPGDAAVSPNRTASDDTAAQPTVGSTAPAPEPADSAGPAIGAPARVSVVADGGTAVSLRWTLAPGSEVYPVLVEVRGQPDSRVLHPLSGGTTAYTVTGLHAGSGYCFAVGLLLRIGAAGQPATQVWSQDACVRGGTSRTRGA